VLGEDLCCGYQDIYGLPITIFRFALAVAGDEILDWPQFRMEHWLRVYANKEGDTARQVHGQLQSLHRAGKELLIARDESGRSYKKHIADVRDLVGGMMAGLGNQRAIGQTFQLAAPAPFTWERAVPYLADELGLAYGDVRLADHNPTFYEFDLRKGKELLGFQPRYDIITMIDDAVAFRRGETADVIGTQA
jgi:nucleoside-diphosphate-sugar epimerase